MDPLSITTACIGLLVTVTKTTLAVTNFTRDCREARPDLISIKGELSQLQLVLELLRDDTAVSDDTILPGSLQTQVLSIIDNCSAVVSKINIVLDEHAGKVGGLKWATFGKNEVLGLRMSLEAHRGSLNLALELVSVSLSKAIKSDTTAIKTDVHDIRQDTSQIPQILDELTRLRTLIAGGNIPSSTTNGKNYILQQYLDDLTSYAETVCSDVEWETDKRNHSPPQASSLSGLRNVSSAPVTPQDTSIDTSFQADSTTNGLVNTEGGDTSLEPARSVVTGGTSQDMYEMKRKLVLIGDPACGKTALCHRMYENTFYSMNWPTVFDQYTTHVNGIELAMWDTGGLEEHDRIRPRSYPNADMVLVCFAIDSPDSLSNVTEKWINEVSHFAPNSPFLLVGLKKDLRDHTPTIELLKQSGEQPVSWGQGMTLAQSLGATGYTECSAKTGEGMTDVFKAAMRKPSPEANVKNKKTSKELRRMIKRILSG